MIRAFFIIILTFNCGLATANEDLNNLKDSVYKTFETYDLSITKDELITTGIWSSDKKSFLVHVPRGIDSLLYIFLKQIDNSYLSISLSNLVNSEINYKLGYKKSYYDRYEQQATLTTDYTGYIVGVSIITRAWKDGQRYTVEKKPVLLKINGEALYP